MKKRLLITLGCSITEGVGCYDFEVNPERINYGELKGESYEITKNRFHEYGWPNHIGTLCNFDKVLNLGSAASGNSLHLKLFVDKILPQIHLLKQEYDLFLIWMLSEHTRFSFYTDKEIKKFMPSGRRFNFDNIEMEHAYVNSLEEFEIGPLRETIFLLKTSEYIFKDCGISPIITKWSSMYGDLDLEDMYHSTSLLTNSKSFNVFAGIRQNKELMSGVKNDLHPNEKGYKVMAENIFEEIKRYHPYFISSNSVSTFEWEWDGDSRYKHNFEFYTKVN